MYKEIDLVEEEEDLNLISLEEMGLPIVLDTMESQALFCELIGMRELSDSIRASITEDMYH